YQADGNVEFLGRIDHQVKIRGFRIELGELEAVLQQHPQVREVVVIVCENNPGDQRLVAYVVSDKTAASPPELRQFLKERLPDYIVPAAFVNLDTLPLTPNGKIDRKALPSPKFQLVSDQVFIPPRNPLELELTQIWAEILQVEPISVIGNFFDLGGHSLLAVSLMSRIKQRLGRTLPLVTLFQGATIEQQALLLQQQADPQAWSPLISLRPRGSHPPLFFIHPGGSSVMNYQRLVPYLGTRRSIYGLEARGFEPGQLPDTSIKKMAADYIEVIQTVQPKGPYLLAGWCLGGTIAWEMAQQFLLQGEQVPRFIFIDVNSSMAMEQIPDTTQLLAELVGRYLNLSVADLESLTSHLRSMTWEEQLVYVIAEAEHRNLSLSPGFGVEQLNCIVQVQWGHDHAAQHYSPQPYPGEVILFQAEEGVAAQAEDSTLGWHALAQQVTLHWVPGNHLSMMRDPHVQVLAQHLQDYL
ncbi:MAG: non-ribosomal peptide synthetase, partial [Symploca sp. SIO2D2]|nr:non-ribosomal peptide synthetase [Symploca sp. SIO2D2]